MDKLRIKLYGSGIQLNQQFLLCFHAQRSRNTDTRLSNVYDNC